MEGHGFSRLLLRAWRKYLQCEREVSGVLESHKDGKLYISDGLVYPGHYDTVVLPKDCPFSFHTHPHPIKGVPLWEAYLDMPSEEDLILIKQDRGCVAHFIVSQEGVYRVSYEKPVVKMRNQQLLRILHDLLNEVRMEIYDSGMDCLERVRKNWMENLRPLGFMMGFYSWEQLI